MQKSVLISLFLGLFVTSSYAQMAGHRGEGGMTGQRGMAPMMKGMMGQQGMEEGQNVSQEN